jgi:hypothetical protein
MSSSIRFFATKRDLEELIAAAESRRPVKFVRSGVFDSSDLVTLTSGSQIPQLGYAPSGDHNHEPIWLVVNREEEIKIRPVEQRRGGVRYAVDQRDNPRSVTFSAGGVFEGSSVIDGSVSTCTDDSTSRELLNQFAREVRRRFKRIKSFFVGPEAEQLLDAGYRLTSNVKAPKEYDLSRA